MRGLIPPDVKTVAGWEFFNNLRTPTFLALTFAVPVVMLIVGMVGVYTQQTAEEEVARVAVIDETGEMKPLLQRHLGDYPLSLHPVDTDAEKTRARIREGEFAGMLQVDEESVQTGLFTYCVASVPEAQVPAVHKLVEVSFVAYRLRDMGLTRQEIEAVTGAAALHVTPVHKGRDLVGGILIPLLMAATLVFASIFSGQMLMYGVIKEKRNRIVEVLLSSTSASHLLWGKLLGYGGLGLLQVGIWSVAAVAVVSRFYALPEVFPSAGDMLIYLTYFLGGYLLLATVHAAMGATMKEVEGGSQAQGLVVIVPMAPVFLASPLIMSPNALWVRILCHVPPFIPTASLIRLAVAEVPSWEIATSLGVLFGCCLVLMRISSRIFAGGMLRFSGLGSLAELGQLMRGD